VVGVQWNPQMFVNFPVTKVSRCVSRNAKTIGLQHWTCVRIADLQIGHDHRTDELLVDQHTISDGQAASPVKEGAKHAQSLGCLLSQLVDVRLPGKLCIKGHTKVPCYFGPLN
jgi:hypothetical protein